MAVMVNPLLTRGARINGTGSRSTHAAFPEILLPLLLRAVKTDGMMMISAAIRTTLLLLAQSPLTATIIAIVVVLLA